MLNRHVRNEIGQSLRAVYADIPKGGIPSLMWQQLLEIEQRITETDRLSRTGPSGSAGMDRLPSRPARAVHG
jgi:hypothetical protein